MFKENTTNDEKNIYNSTVTNDYYEKVPRNILLLGKEFDNIRLIVSQSNITLSNFTDITQALCSKPFDLVLKTYPKINNLETACFNMTYAINVLEKIYKNDPINLIFNKVDTKDTNLVTIFNRIRSLELDPVMWGIMIFNFISVVF